MLAERNLVISARNMSDRWSGDPNALKLHDLDVLCAVLGCGIGELLIPEPDTDTVAAPAPGPAVDEPAGWPARHDRSSHAHGRAGHCHRDDLPTLRHPISATSRRDRTYCTNRCSALASYYRRKAGLPVPRAGSIPRCPPGESAVRTAAAKALQFAEAHGWDRSSARCMLDGIVTVPEGRPSGQRGPLSEVPTRPSASRHARSTPR
jgi:DNA-binding Xre family transcriptional regulator